jgi:hypothetical protein
MKLTNGYLGLIWEVPLGPDLGYGYVRFTALEDHFGTYVRILNHRSLSRKKGFDADEFASHDELVAPFLGFGRPPGRGDNRWKPIDYWPMQDVDYELPDMKTGGSLTSSPELADWCIIRGMTVGDYLRNNRDELIRFNFNQVKHLGFYGHMNLKFATIRVILEWIKILGMDYMNYENQDVPQDFLEMQKYYVSVSTPYSEVPKEIRGKVIL